MGVSTGTILFSFAVGASAVYYAMQSPNVYYSTVSFVVFSPLAVIYQGLSNIFVNTVVAPLPPASSKKVAIVTGSNTGIGFQTARRLVLDYGWDVMLACRSRDKALKALEKIHQEKNLRGTSHSGKAIVLNHPLDLSDFSSVRQFASTVQEAYPKVDVLINNAGRNTSGPSGKLDLLFQSNFLGHFLLTSMLKENVGRVVNLSSVMHHFAASAQHDEAFWKSMAMYDPKSPPDSYSASKLAAILHTVALRRQGISSVAVNPGGVASDIWRGFPSWIRAIFDLVYLTPEQGSMPVVAAAVVEDAPLYMQPYWQPQHNSATPFPLTEMLGPYVGFEATTPRLPEDEGHAAGDALWKVSEALTST